VSTALPIPQPVQIYVPTCLPIYARPAVRIVSIASAAAAVAS
jgi:hypothetical protein